MYLKSLTLRGFKSFASATTLRLEPGITCVVGPNGSGKSNILDGLSWVMGEQGAKSLRGGKMEDVIFAGTTSRAPLGRAEVTLTIDNTDGALPIDYAEVTISRLMFRSGQSEYSINGDSCRLLDVQDLLSDSGLGREMHVIVGQGQLDQILHAGPEARRAIIEEAARRPQAPQTQGKGAPQARGDAGQPDQAGRPDRRAQPPTEAARPAGRGRPEGRDHPGRPARRPAAAAGRRLPCAPRQARSRSRRRGRDPRPPRPARGGPGPGPPAGGRARRGGGDPGGRARPGTADLVRALLADRAAALRRRARQRARTPPRGRPRAGAARPRPRRARPAGRGAAGGGGRADRADGGGPRGARPGGRRAHRRRGRARRTPSAGWPTPPAPPRAGPSGWPGCAAWSTPLAAAAPPPARRSTG